MFAYMPRFKPEVFDQNLKLVEAVEVIAKRKGVSVGQVAISWVRHQGAIPIPGASKVERVVENCTAVSLSEEDLEEIKRILDTFPVQGERYGGKFEALLNQ
jgi:pyridoxine 4-dehydrogenase